MRILATLSAAALAITATVATPADAQYRHGYAGRHGYHGGGYRHYGGHHRYYAPRYYGGYRRHYGYGGGRVVCSSWSYRHYGHRCRRVSY